MIIYASLYKAVTNCRIAAASLILILLRAQRGRAIIATKNLLIREQQYCNVHGAACVLAGATPWDLDAQVLADVHRGRVEARERGEIPAPAELRQVRSIAQAETLRRWDEVLAQVSAGHRTIEAIRPVLEEWVGRRAVSGWGTGVKTSWILYSRRQGYISLSLTKSFI
ncbi:hypothetical protein evm_009862 [Chilo suppressalis]|nr:hypothetical protein evm_009862 [Chilo suppressalis]